MRVRIIISDFVFWCTCCIRSPIFTGRTAPILGGVATTTNTQSSSTTTAQTSANSQLFSGFSTDTPCISKSKEVMDPSSRESFMSPRPSLPQRRGSIALKKSSNSCCDESTALSVSPPAIPSLKRELSISSIDLVPAQVVEPGDLFYTRIKKAQFNAKLGEAKRAFQYVQPWTPTPVRVLRPRPDCQLCEWVDEPGTVYTFVERCVECRATERTVLCDPEGDCIECARVPSDCYCA